MPERCLRFTHFASRWVKGVRNNPRCLFSSWNIKRHFSRGISDTDWTLLADRWWVVHSFPGMRWINARRCLWSSRRVWIRTDLLLERARQRCNVCKSMPCRGPLWRDWFVIDATLQDIIMKQMLIAQCNGNGIIAPLSWGLPLHKPRSSSQAILCCQQLRELAGKMKSGWWSSPAGILAPFQSTVTSQFWTERMTKFLLLGRVVALKRRSNQMQFEKYFSLYCNLGTSLKTHGKLFTASLNGFNLPSVV